MQYYANHFSMISFTEQIKNFYKTKIAPNHKTILFLAALSFALFSILNAPYIAANLRFLLTKQSVSEPITQTQIAQLHAPDTLSIPSLSIEAPIQFIDKADEKTFQAALKNGVVHYPGTALAGEFGNMYIFGHSSDYIWSKGHYKTIFAVLPSIKNGDEIFVTDSKGTQYTYKVIDTKIVKPNDVSVLDQQGNKKKLLTVQTSYPVGTALRRFVAIAELIP